MTKTHPEHGTQKLVFKREFATVVVYENNFFITNVLEYDDQGNHCECVISKLEKQKTNN